MLRELVSGLLFGIFLVVAGLVLFRFRDAITRYNAEQRRPVLGRFLSEGMRGGDRVTLPLLAVGLCALGIWMIVFTVYSVTHGH